MTPPPPPFFVFLHLLHLLFIPANISYLVDNVFYDFAMGSLIYGAGGWGCRGRGEEGMRGCEQETCDKIFLRCRMFSFLFMFASLLIPNFYFILMFLFRFRSFEGKITCAIRIIKRRENGRRGRERGNYPDRN